VVHGTVFNIQNQAVELKDGSQSLGQAVVQEALKKAKN